MHSVNQHLTVLKRLKRGPQKQRDLILKNADQALVQCLCDCAHNTLKSNVPLTRAQYKNLARHKHILRKIAKPVGCWKKKKKIIKQAGGFLLPLLTPIIGTLLATALA
jgi:hypothetical protein